MIDKNLYKETFSKIKYEKEINMKLFKNESLKVHKMNKKVVILAAAIILVTSLAIGATFIAANYIKSLSMKFLALPDELQKDSSFFAADTEPCTFIPVTGLLGTAESDALIEWETFKKEYDPDEDILRTAINNGSFDDFAGYNVDGHTRRKWQIKSTKSMQNTI